MSLKAGIVGLPNVGKSTLFNAITKKNILAANYPFATIDPNVGMVTVPDKRLAFLEELYIPSTVVEIESGAIRSVPNTVLNIQAEKALPMYEKNWFSGVKEFHYGINK